MNRIRNVLVPATVLVLTAALVAAAQPQAGQGARRRSARGMGRGTLLGLLRLEQVQKEIKLNEEQIAKVKKVSDELNAERRKQFTALREIEDRQQRREKMMALSAQLDKKAREPLGKVLAKEQMARLEQIRMQVRSALESLASADVAGKLKLTKEQTAKLAEISKDMQAKRTELFRGMRDATQEERREAFQKYRKLRTDADKEALDVLKAEQKKAFEAMKGKKIELQAPTRRRRDA